ncbi:MAG: AAA family ATPase [bacterium]|nr:AAA family ATPase [bacterium]
MYCDFFGLRQPPFDDVPDARFFFPSADHEEALALLRLAAAQRKGPVLLTGGLGTGKTLLCRSLLTGSGLGGVPVLGTCTPGDTSGLIRRVCKALNVRLHHNAGPAADAEKLHKFIAASTSAREPYVLLVLDQVENLSADDFEELNILCNVEDRGRRLIQIILIGQPAAIETLDAPRFEQLRQRMYAFHRLSLLNREEVSRYVAHRLAVAGHVGEALFEDDALATVFERSGGVPRLINQICDAALLAAYGAGMKTVGKSTIAEVQLPSVNLSAAATRSSNAVEDRSMRTDVGASVRRAGAPEGDTGQLAAMTGRIDQILSQGEHLARRLEDKLQRGEPMPAGVGTSDGGETAQHTAGQLSGLMQTAPQVLAETRGALEQVEQRIEAASERAERVASRLEATLARTEQLDRQMTTNVAERLAADGQAAVQKLTERLNKNGSDTIARAEQTMRRVADQAARLAAEAADLVERAEAASGRLDQGIATGEETARAVEHRLVEHLTGARCSVETLRATIDQAGEGADELRARIAGARQQADELNASTAEAATACGRTSDSVEQAVAANHQLDEAVARSDQAVDRCQKAAAAVERRLESGYSAARTAITELRSEVQNREKADHLLQATIDAAEGQATELAALVPEAKQVSDRAGAIVADASRIERLRDDVDVQRKEVPELAARLALQGRTARAMIEQCTGQLDQAERATNALTHAVDEAAPLMEKLNRDAGKVDQVIHKLAEQREAARATIQRQQMLHERDGATIEQLDTRIGQAEELQESLSAHADRAGQLQRELATGQDQLADALRGMTEKIQAVDARKQHLDAAEQALAEFVDQAERIGQQIGALKGRADSLEVYLNELLAKPEATVADAKVQSRQLQDVCRAVRKIFAGLSQATLNANRRIEQFGRLSQTADAHSRQLGAETTRAAVTLRTWVDEALRAQTRLAESLERCPTMVQTHPVEPLRNLAALADQGVQAADRARLSPAPTDRGATPSTDRLTVSSPARAKSRAEEISQLIAEARKFSEATVEAPTGS